ncbi:MAG: HEAT repeat domain-containing protein [Candidatus Methylumidiphilus sp.]
MKSNWFFLAMGLATISIICIVLNNLDGFRQITEIDSAASMPTKSAPVKPELSGSLPVWTESTTELSINKEIERLRLALQMAEKRNQELTKKLTELSSQKAIPVANAIEGQCQALSEKLDGQLTYEALYGLYSTDFPTRAGSLKALAQLQNANARELLLQVVMNEQENPALRRELIRATDWHGSLQQAIQLFSTSSDESVKAALILAAQDSHLDEGEKQSFEEAIMGAFRQGNGDFIQFAAMDYLANNNRERLSGLGRLTEAEGVALSEATKKHYEFYQSVLSE